MNILYTLETGNLRTSSDSENLFAFRIHHQTDKIDLSTYRSYLNGWDIISADFHDILPDTIYLRGWDHSYDNKFEDVVMPVDQIVSASETLEEFARLVI